MDIFNNNIFQNNAVSRKDIELKSQMHLHVNISGNLKNPSIAFPNAHLNRRATTILHGLYNNNGMTSIGNRSQNKKIDIYKNFSIGHGHGHGGNVANANPFKKLSTIMHMPSLKNINLKNNSLGKKDTQYADPQVIKELILESKENEEKNISVSKNKKNKEDSKGSDYDSMNSMEMEQNYKCENKDEEIEKTEVEQMPKKQNDMNNEKKKVKIISSENLLEKEDIDHEKSHENDGKFFYNQYFKMIIKIL